VPNVVLIWSIFLKLQAVKQNGLVFKPPGKPIDIVRL